MEEDNEIITIYKNKIQKVWMLGIVAIFLILVYIVLFKVELAPGESESVRIEIAGFFLIFVVVFSWIFYDANKSNKNSLFIKENGNVFQGRVLHVKKKTVTSTNNHVRIIRKLLVEFFDGYENRLIVSEHFPYYIDTNDPNLVDLITNKLDMDEYNHSYNDNLVEHIQYNGKGYITFDNSEGNRILYKYNDSKNQNYKGYITCKVYEYEGKYVVDDFEGYEK